MNNKRVTRVEEVINAVALISSRENSQPYFTVIRKDLSQKIYSGAVDAYKDYNPNLITINRGVAINLSIVKSFNNNILETEIGNLKVARERIKLIQFKLNQLWTN